MSRGLLGGGTHPINVRGCEAGHIKPDPVDIKILIKIITRLKFNSTNLDPDNIILYKIATGYLIIVKRAPGQYRQKLKIDTG